MTNTKQKQATPYKKTAQLQSATTSCVPSPTSLIGHLRGEKQETNMKACQNGGCLIVHPFAMRSKVMP